MATKLSSELVVGDVVSHAKFFGAGVPVTISDVRPVKQGMDSPLSYTLVCFYGVPESCACSHAAYAKFTYDTEVTVHSK